MKLILKLLVVILIIAIIGGVVAINNVEKIVSKAGTETLGVPVSVGNIGMAGLLSGNLGISDLTVANPEGFKAEKAFSLNNIDVSVDMDSVKGDVIRIKHVKIKQPEITLEVTKNRNNLQTLINNAKSKTQSSSSTSSKGEPGEAKSTEKNVTIDLVEINGGKVQVITPLASKPLNVDLPAVKIENIGKDNENGIPLSEAIEIIIKTISTNASKIDINHLRDQLDGLKGQVDGIKDMGKDLEDKIKEGDVEGLKGAADKLKKLF